jgi:hypothetical protein
MKRDSIRLHNAAAAIRFEKIGSSSAITLPSNASRMKAVVMAPHAYGPGAILGAWRVQRTTPNKPLAGHLVATLPPEPPPPLPAPTSIQL